MYPLPHVSKYMGQWILAILEVSKEHLSMRLLCEVFHGINVSMCHEHMGQPALFYASVHTEGNKGQ